MKIPGLRLIKKAESKGNEVEVPVTENLGLVDFFKLTYKEMSEDHVMAFAGNLTYKGLFAIFPFFTFLLSLLGLFNATDLVNTMVDKLSGIVPQSATKFVEGQLLSITQSQAESAFTFGAIISILLVLVIFGESIGVRVADLVGLGSVFATLWSIVQWPVVALVVLFAFALIYYFAPAARQRFRWISPGSILAFVFWLIFSLLFSLYASMAGSYNETYGSLAGVIILLLYVYYSALIMLVGAEINQVIEWHIPGGKNEGEKIPEEDRRPDVHRLNRKHGEAR